MTPFERDVILAAEMFGANDAARLSGVPYEIFERYGFGDEGLAQVTSQAQWHAEGLYEAEKATAKAIGTRQWQEAFAYAAIFDRIVPWLPKPTPGADPAGFIWLTYQRGLSKLALEVHPSPTASLRWSMVSPSGERREQANGTAGLQKVAECLRVVFPRG